MKTRYIAVKALYWHDCWAVCSNGPELRGHSLFVCLVVYGSHYQLNLSWRDKNFGCQSRNTHWDDSQEGAIDDGRDPQHPSSAVIVSPTTEVRADMDLTRKLAEIKMQACSWVELEQEWPPSSIELIWSARDEECGEFGFLLGDSR